MFQTKNLDPADDKLSMSLELDLFDEKELAVVRTTPYMDQATKFYNKSVQHCQFKIGDLV